MGVEKSAVWWLGGVVVGAVWRGVWWLEGEFLWRDGYLKKRLDIVNRFRDNKIYLTYFITY